MFIKFDGRLINTNAISEVYAVQQNDQYKIMLFRLDGSYLTSESFSVASKAADRFDELTNILIETQEEK